MIKNNYVAVFALFITIAFVMISGCTGTDDAMNTVPSGNNVPSASGDAMSSSVTMPKDPKVFDKAYTQYLLDQIMALCVNNPDDWREVRRQIVERTYVSSASLWDPELELLPSETISDVLIIQHKENVDRYSLYSGPVVLWWRDEPNGKIYYEGLFITIPAKLGHQWNRSPYEYGIETCSDPPPEILKVLSDNNIKLIY